MIRVAFSAVELHFKLSQTLTHSVESDGVGRTACVCLRIHCKVPAFSYSLLSSGLLAVHRMRQSILLMWSMANGYPNFGF